MGRKSKRRGGKSKRGGKQHSPSDRTAEIITPLSSMSLAEEGSGNGVLQGNNTDQVPGLTQRDEFVEEATSATDPDDNDVRDHFILLTSLKRKVVVELADMFFGDRGAEFRNKYTEAADEALALMEKMKKDGHDEDTDDQLRLVKDTLFAMNKLMDEKIKESGQDSPFAQLEEPLHNTKFDHELFQPCPPRPDCPICFIPLPERDECCYHPCCGREMCDGCVYAHQDAKDELGVENSCPFCRESVNVPVSENIKRTEKRMELGDCNAFCMLGGCYLQGRPPMKRNTKKGVELLNQAAELGSESAHHTLGVAYAEGVGVKEDKEKALYHLRLAAIGGMAESRCALGLVCLQRDLNLAYKHFIIAAKAGHDESLKEVKTGYAKGQVEKDVLEKVLRAHQAAKDSVKSEARDKADSRRRQAGTGRHDPHSRIIVRDL